MKLVEEESEQVAYDGHKVPQYYAKDYLERYGQCSVLCQYVLISNTL